MLLQARFGAGGRDTQNPHDHYSDRRNKEELHHLTADDLLRTFPKMLPIATNNGRLLFCKEWALGPTDLYLVTDLLLFLIVINCEILYVNASKH